MTDEKLEMINWTKKEIERLTIFLEQFKTNRAMKLILSGTEISIGGSILGGACPKLISDLEKYLKKLKKEYSEY